MLTRIAHRGPDDEGLESVALATIGARRLAVLDLVGGHQPMHNEDGTILAVQNGEIYNFRELRSELETAGHSFRTRNDTEILPHAYEEWGEALLDRLRGMYAVAIWDSRQARLLLARDRFGKKPLVYAELPGGGLAFASEIQALLVHPLVGREIDDEAIADYLTFGYIPAPRTAFLSVKKVPPAHRLIWDRERVGHRRYWSLRFEPKIRTSIEEAAEEIRERINDAVRVRMISDVPIGAFLSGGLDSSTVVAFMARHSTRPVRTFSVGFTDHRYDERTYARAVAEALGTDHQELVVDAGDTRSLPALLRHVGEPFADSSLIPTFEVARATRLDVTVALTGDGGDELFAGYDRYKAGVISARTFDRVPASLSRLGARIAAVMPEHSMVPEAMRRARRFIVAAGLPGDERFVRWTGYFTGAMQDKFFGERLRRFVGREHLLLQDAAEISGASDVADRYMASDVIHNLPGDLLVKMDIASMANSLETRSPLLDHVLAEYVARLPVEMKVSPRTSKILLRRAMTGVLPEQIVRRGKMGFMAPVSDWLRGPLREMVREMVLAPSADRGYVSQSAARSLLFEHETGRAHRTALLWSLLVLEVWFRECVDDPSSQRRD